MQLDQFGSAFYSNGSPGSGYGRLDYGRVWTNGSISCSIDPNYGTYCSNNDGGYFRIRLQDITMKRPGFRAGFFRVRKDSRHAQEDRSGTEGSCGAAGGRAPG